MGKGAKTAIIALSLHPHRGIISIFLDFRELETSPMDSEPLYLYLPSQPCERLIINLQTMCGRPLIKQEYYEKS
jgi:hypothetical protein